MSQRNQRAKGLNEGVLRVRDLDATQHFYEAVIGLELIQRFPDMAFLKIADGYAGLIQILALFADSLSGDVDGQDFQGLNPDQTTLHHFALAIARADYDLEWHRLEQLGLAVQTAEHAWMGWRSLYVRDPEGNVVELVCSDSAEAYVQES